MRRFAFVITAATLVLCVGAATATAQSIGVGTDTGRIKVSDRLAAGGTYPLPMFRIGNTGTDGMGYVLKVAPYQGQVVPSAWVKFTPDVLYLKPDQWADVQATLEIPGDAQPGHYVALLAASPKMPDGGAPTKVNIGAGPRLEIDVIAGSPLKAALWEVRRWFAEHRWPAVLAGGVLVVLIVFIGLVVRVRLRRRRRLAARLAQ